MVKTDGSRDSALCFLSFNADRMSVSSIDSLSPNPLRLSSAAGSATSALPPNTRGASPGRSRRYNSVCRPGVGRDPRARSGYRSPGRHLLDLLDFAIETSDPEGIQVQWDLLLSSALEARVPVPATRGDNGSFRDRIPPILRCRQVLSSRPCAPKQDRADICSRIRVQASRKVEPSRINPGGR